VAAFSATSATTVTVDRVHCLCLHNGHDRRRCRPCCDFIDWCRYLIKTSSSINKRASTLFHAFHLFTTITNCQWGCLEAARTPKQQHGCRSLLVLLNPWTVTKFVCEVWNLWRVYLSPVPDTGWGPKVKQRVTCPWPCPLWEQFEQYKICCFDDESCCNKLSKIVNSPINTNNQQSNSKAQA